MSVLYRRMCLEDVAAVHAIDILSFSLPWPRQSYIYEVNENRASRSWVAESEGKVAAMLVLWLIIDEAHVATIATHPDYRRQGIGERLLVEALLAVHSEGAKSAFLEVRAGNLGAQAMYHKYGFIVDGIRRGYYKDTQEDAILMSMPDLGELKASETTGNVQAG